MSWKKVMAAAPLLCGLISLPAVGAVYTFSSEFSGSGDACDNPSCATLTVTANATGGVDFVLQADLEGPEKITAFYGNQDPFTLGTTSAILCCGGTSGADVLPPGAGEVALIGSNAFKADGDGFFDWVIDIATSDALQGDDTLTWTITNTTLASITNALSADGGGSGPFTFALRVQAIGDNNEGSGWFSPTIQQEPPAEDTPEPGSLLLLGLGMAGLALMQRRRRRV